MVIILETIYASDNKSVVVDKNKDVHTMIITFLRK